jgi:hypothetical protein
MKLAYVREYEGPLFRVVEEDGEPVMHGSNPVDEGGRRTRGEADALAGLINKRRQAGEVTDSAPRRGSWLLSAQSAKTDRARVEAATEPVVAEPEPEIKAPKPRKRASRR